MLQCYCAFYSMSAALAMPADIYDTSFQGNESPDRSDSNSHVSIYTLLHTTTNKAVI